MRHAGVRSRTVSARGTCGGRTCATLHALNALGVTLALDDFGTGYSSLSQLKHLPLQAVKIDRGFVSALATRSADHAIVRAVLGMARALDLRVVAEGIETEQQLALLREMNCDLAQGYLLGRPDVPAALARRQLTRRPSRCRARPS